MCYSILYLISPVKSGFDLTALHLNFKYTVLNCNRNDIKICFSYRAWQYIELTWICIYILFIFILKCVKCLTSVHFATFLPWEVFPIAFEHWFIKCFKPAMWRMCLLWFNLLRQMSLASCIQTFLFISVFSQFETLNALLAFVTALYITVWTCWAFSVTTRVIILSLDSLPMDDIWSKWRQTALIQLPVAAETLSTVVDKCYTKVLSNRVHFLWTIKLCFPDIFWTYRYLITNSMTWLGHISCQGQRKGHISAICHAFHFRQWCIKVTYRSIWSFIEDVSYKRVCAVIFELFIKI